MCIDAGKIMKTPYLNVLIGNSFSKESPIVLITIPNFKRTKIEYQKSN